MNITILTLFPEIFIPFLSSSIIGRAIKNKLVAVNMVNLRDFGEGTHKIVDDRPFGGGAGMVLKADVLARAVQSITIKDKFHTILTSASGKVYNQNKATQLSQKENVLIICGHYEGIDQRFIDLYVDEEISIGDYVLTGGELPAQLITDSIVRLLPNVLKKAEATIDESFSSGTGGMLEYPHYTRPEVFEGLEVPTILKSGDHQKIAEWKKNQSLEKTRKLRPDLLP